MSRICEYTGKSYEGLGVIVMTTEGQKVMSRAGFAQFVADSGAAPAAPAAAPTTPEVPTNE